MQIKFEQQVAVLHVNAWMRRNVFLCQLFIINTFVSKFEQNTGKNWNNQMLCSFKTCRVVVITSVFKFRQLIALSVNVKKIFKLFKLLLLYVVGGQYAYCRSESKSLFFIWLGTVTEVKFSACGYKTFTLHGLQLTTSASWFEIE